MTLIFHVLAHLWNLTVRFGLSRGALQERGNCPGWAKRAPQGPCHSLKALPNDENEDDDEKCEDDGNGHVKNLRLELAQAGWSRPRSPGCLCGPCVHWHCDELTLVVQLASFALLPEKFDQLEEKAGLSWHGRPRADDCDTIRKLNLWADPTELGANFVHLLLDNHNFNLGAFVSLKLGNFGLDAVEQRVCVNEQCWLHSNVLSVQVARIKIMHHASMPRDHEILQGIHGSWACLSFGVQTAPADSW